MPASVDIQRDNRLAIVHWENPVIHDDFMKVFGIMGPVYAEAKAPIYNIYMAIGLTNLPPRAISTYLKDPRSPLVHPMSAKLIVVTATAFIRVMVETAAKMSPAGRLTTATSLDEALAKIEQAMQRETSS
jgi:hypothetical protein